MHEQNTCKRCHESKPLSEFQWHAGRNALLDICRVCMGKAASEGMHKSNGNMGGMIASRTAEPRIPTKPARLLEQPPDHRRIQELWLPQKLLTRAREFEAAGEVSRWGYDTRHKNSNGDEDDVDLEIRPWGADESEPWFRINVCGKASVGKKRQTVLRKNRCDAVMYYDDQLESWIVVCRSGVQFPKVKIV